MKEYEGPKRKETSENSRLIPWIMLVHPTSQITGQQLACDFLYTLLDFQSILEPVEHEDNIRGYIHTKVGIGITV